MKSSNRVAVYVRVSTRDQSVQAQERELRDYCKRRGWKSIAVFREKASGSKASRPVLAELLAAARAGKIDIVVVYKLDRLGRSLSHLMQIVAELSRLKIGVIASSQGIDTSKGSAVGDLQVQILGAVASFESELIRERTLSGVANARKKGVTLGRPPASLAIVEQVIALRKKRNRAGSFPSYRDIAGQLNISVGTVCRILKVQKAAAA